MDIYWITRHIQSILLNFKHLIFHDAALVGPWISDIPSYARVVGRYLTLGVLTSVLDHTGTISYPYKTKRQ